MTVDFTQKNLPDEYQGLSNVNRFSHNAMATIFDIYIQSKETDYARQAADAAFEEMDRLEQELSRYIENSDISQINSLKDGQEIRIGLDAFESLSQCKILYERTEGAFDITAGLLYDCWLKEDKTLRQPSQQELDFALHNTGLEMITLNEDQHTLRLEGECIKLDLGGFGKGYAVDKMAEMLRRWSLPNALISAGQSSVLALDAPVDTTGWPVTISNPRDRKENLNLCRLKKRALGGSGLEVGYHIIDPFAGNPVKAKIAAWAAADNAATADALSTAFMIMTQEQIEKYVTEHEDVSAIIITGQIDAGNKSNILRLGRW